MRWGRRAGFASSCPRRDGFAAVGAADPVIGGLQRRYPGLRPVLFHSPYEAAVSFLIGHRISIAQGRAIRRRIAEEHGAAIPTPAGVGHAFPAPSVLLACDALPSVPAVKLERVHAAARAAIEGTLDRGRLRATPEAAALVELSRLPGVGPFFAQGILTRGVAAISDVGDRSAAPVAAHRGGRAGASSTAVISRATTAATRAAAMLCGSMPRRGSLVAVLFGVLAMAACGPATSATPTSAVTQRAAGSATLQPSGGAVSAIGSTGSTCSQFASGKLGELTRLRYASSGGKVSSVTPPTFDYWVRVTPAAAPPTSLAINESTAGGGPALSATGGDVFQGGAGATCVPLSNSVSYSAGLTTVTFTATKGSTYFVQVHFTAAALVGRPLGSNQVSVSVSTAAVSGSTRDLALSAA